MASLDELEKAIERGIEIYAQNEGVRFSKSDMKTDIMSEVQKLFPKPKEPERCSKCHLPLSLGHERDSSWECQGHPDD